MTKWKNNYAIKCPDKELNPDLSLQVASLRGCGYPTVLYGTYVFTLYRWQILWYSTVPVQDWDVLV